jgi:hypothetical protein
MNTSAKASISPGERYRTAYRLLSESMIMEDHY